MYCTTAGVIQQVNWPLESVYSFKPKRFSLNLSWFISDSFSGQDCACVLPLLEYSELPRNIYYLPLMWIHITQICWGFKHLSYFVPAGWKLKKKMESTSISALHNSELHPDDLSCFGFSFALMIGLTSDKWLAVL